MGKKIGQKYIQERDRLISACRIAVEALDKYKLDGEYVKGTVGFLDYYKSRESSILNADEKYQNLVSLKYSIEEVFTYFNEGSGKEVEYFWSEVSRKGLGYKRKNRLATLLKRKKIKNIIEFDFVKDTLVAYYQQGVINNEEFELLDQMIIDFENKNKNNEKL